jgi:predicted nucleic acid-binding protein
MPSAGLIDTGAIVAIIDVSESWHRPCLEALATMRMPMSTTEAVLTEFFHLIHARSLNMERAWRFVRSGVLSIHPMQDSDMPELQRLMDDYGDRPMDFADATLVHLAARESLSTILSIDHDHFETYRLPGRKKFNILPLRQRG